ncbi:MAG TPA: hypothetical protein VMU69_00355, partial [Bradyrhizobium sp.]|nr:hypothetical protein [Bradyrhizobium sp.]
AVRKLASQENVIVIRFFEAMQMINKGAGSGLPADEFERNELGYDCVAQYVAQAITLSVFAKTMPSRR